MREYRPMFSSVGCFSYRLWFFLCRLEQQVLVFEAEVGQWSRSSQSRAIGAAIGPQREGDKASSMVRSRQCALNASYCPCCGWSLLGGSVGAQICRALRLGSGAVKQAVYSKRNGDKCENHASADL